jgi:hypothetical protein
MSICQLGGKCKKEALMKAECTTLLCTVYFKKTRGRKGCFRLILIFSGKGSVKFYYHSFVVNEQCHYFIIF